MCRKSIWEIQVPGNQHILMAHVLRIYRSGRLCLSLLEGCRHRRTWYVLDGPTACHWSAKSHSVLLFVSGKWLLFEFHTYLLQAGWFRHKRRQATYLPAMVSSQIQYLSSLFHNSDQKFSKLVLVSLKNWNIWKASPNPILSWESPSKSLFYLNLVVHTTKKDASHSANCTELPNV